MTISRDSVYKAIDSERNYQDKKWGTIQEHPHEVGGYLTLMRKLLTDAEAAWSSSAGDHGAMVEIRKVLAVGVACAEQHFIPERSLAESETNTL